MKVKDMILNQFVLGCKYEITHHDEDNGYTVYKGIVADVDETSVQMSVYETDGEEDRGSTWINWRNIYAFEKI
ncbi:hypothetical protein FT641_18215 [Bacillus paranthracis]|uniref:hypothetical protein n=1 Tax=Bacillus paranthracis TaxID=2026186 RepID=UPI001879F284|nr:hypothetical protein [Bacillus paranthracis]MBE7114502.1 hypothetical protein [Bacillus paranthracis]MBE7154624.1 hypothetical protein [Bacillus paranthracis]